jgi:predicted nuclease with TOPRIM domain
MYLEMVEAFAEVGRRIRGLDERQTQVEAGLARVVEAIANLKEDMEDLEHKVDAFIREQIKMKRRLDEVRESAGLAK